MGENRVFTRICWRRGRLERWRKLNYFFQILSLFIDFFQFFLLLLWDGRLRCVRVNLKDEISGFHGITWVGFPCDPGTKNK